MIDILKLHDYTDTSIKKPIYDRILYHNDDYELCGTASLFNKKDNNTYSSKTKMQNIYIKSYREQKNNPQTDTIKQINEQIPIAKTKIQNISNKNTNILSTNNNDNFNENSSIIVTRRDQKINNGNRVLYTHKYIYVKKYKL